MSDNTEKAERPILSMRAIAIATLGELARDPGTSISARHAVVKKLAQIVGSGDPDAAEAAVQLDLIQHPRSRNR